MSRGPGKIQRYIVDQVERRQELIPLIVLAKLYATAEGVVYTPHLRSSFRRAADSLGLAGEIVGWEVFAPVREFANGEYAWRWVTCIAPAGTDVTEEDENAARTGMILLGVE